MRCQRTSIILCFFLFTFLLNVTLALSHPFELSLLSSSSLSSSFENLISKEKTLQGETNKYFCSKSCSANYETTTMCRQDNNENNDTILEEHQQHQRSPVQDDIVIRPYQKQDLDQIIQLFKEGMYPLGLVLAKMTMVKKLKTPSWDNPLVLPLAPILAVSWTAKFNLLEMVVAYTGGVSVVSLVWWIVLLYHCRKIFYGYVARSLTEDLASMDDVYNKDGGCFLVAELEKRIVGMVGGEFKEESANGQRTYELRRMSVDTQVRGRGLGKRLVRTLEETLDRPSKMFLTCSNTQFAAHALYRGQGFELKETNSFFPITGFERLTFEKSYTNTH